MQPTRCCASAIAALTTLLALDAQDDRQARLAGARDAYSEWRYGAERVRFYEDAFVNDYRSRRTQESPAHTDVENLLRQYAADWNRDMLLDDVARRRLLLQTRPVFQRGCEDPLVLLVAGHAIFMRRQFDAAKPLLQRFGVERELVEKDLRTMPTK